MNRQASWKEICKLEEILPNTGVCALVDGQQIAVFRVGDRTYAVGNHDPFSRANVLSRGLVGDRGGVLKVASPLYKHNFALETGLCLDDPAVRIPAFASRVRDDGVVEVAVPAKQEQQATQDSPALAV